MKKQLRLKVNGIERDVLAEPWESLADILRNHLKLTGLKIGCNEGNCGSCTVIMDGKAVKSCLVLAPKSNGKEIVTIEGLMDENNRLHPLQETFIEYFAIQCGYCTPGMILAAKTILDENVDVTEEEVRRLLQGNLCRCTGYKKIIEAVLAARNKMICRGQ